MVKYEDDTLNRTFAALADPTRRALLARLALQDELSVSALAQPFAMSLPAVMKHLDVLAEAGLVTRAKTGRTVACRLAAGPMEDAMQWLAHYERFWSGALDRLAAFVEEDACPPNPTLAQPATQATTQAAAQATAQTTVQAKSKPKPQTLAPAQDPQAAQPTPAPASSSGAASTRAPRRSTRHGRKPRN
ncbi:ArsR/SmtB family transcription factor [Paraburkholderia oxyphila]|uniref:ArsR/SmtB family transcription factor n=1 Tax=Paraburkholderia oxyphila TaxID=614212 RepID=UPI0009FEE35B|nr:helix-turn-helix transcriptional regulator [Paraburkholderia oxyphila]